jgi:bis(5'-nucleosyl)-tetraphosphatase (symmetrical)
VRWIVGDLQGCARELDALLEAIAYDEQRDQLWSCGDLINRGPDSLATVRRWRELGGRGVIGNHEVYALMARSGCWPRKQDTLEPLFSASDADQLFDSLRALPALVCLPGHGECDDVWLVHAGVHPQWHDLHAVATALEAREHDDEWLTCEEVGFATRVRCCTETGERNKFDGRPEECPPPFRPWDAFYEGSARIVHGHWAWRGHYRGPRTIGLDSGCVYGGPLTAWCMEEDRVVQVPSTLSRR